MTSAARDEHVTPEVSEAARAPGLGGEPGLKVLEAVPVEALLAAEENGGVLECADSVDLDAMTVESSTRSDRRVVGLVECGGMCDADDAAVVDPQRHERRPHRNLAHEVVRAVDGIDDPGRCPTYGLAAGCRGQTLLFAQDVVGGPRGRDVRADGGFRGEIGLGHPGAVVFAASLGILPVVV